MGSHRVVVVAPGLDLRARIVEIQKPVLVEALVPKLPLNDSMKALSTGLPGRMKWSSTRRR